jgi:hypothetical protein
MPQHSRPVKSRALISVGVGKLVLGGVKKGRRCCCLSPTGCHQVKHRGARTIASCAGNRAVTVGVVGAVVAVGVDAALVPPAATSATTW